MGKSQLANEPQTTGIFQWNYLSQVWEFGETFETRESNIDKAERLETNKILIQPNNCRTSTVVQVELFYLGQKNMKLGTEQNL